MPDYATFYFQVIPCLVLVVAECLKGTPEVFWKSLSKIKQLPEETIIYCGHEYTLSNVKFALSIHPDNQDLQKYANWVENQEEEHRPSLPIQTYLIN